ncbi:MAG: purine-binding chemotaxis protein CheW [Spirochaetales bacterium]|nr:purine-binding chemotaxis protein CheW [Spirochaetales bacterium]
MKEFENTDIEQLNERLSEISNIDEDSEEEDLLVSQLNMDITNQYVVFSLANEEYGVPILSVQEIISIPNLTRIPGAPDYIPGIINLRGNIIPLYMLRRRFKLDVKELDENTIVIIAQIGDGKTVGFIVDSVSDVLSISAENLSETPDFNSSIDINFVDKIGRIGSRMIILMNLNRFLTDKEAEALEKSVKVLGQ